MCWDSLRRTSRSLDPHLVGRRGSVGGDTLRHYQSVGLDTNYLKGRLRLALKENKFNQDILVRIVAPSLLGLKKTTVSKTAAS